MVSNACGEDGGEAWEDVVAGTKLNIKVELRQVQKSTMGEKTLMRHVEARNQ
jgi:hypothetical protein